MTKETHLECSNRFFSSKENEDVMRVITIENRQRRRCAEYGPKQRLDLGIIQNRFLQLRFLEARHIEFAEII